MPFTPKEEGSATPQPEMPLPTGTPLLCWYQNLNDEAEEWKDIPGEEGRYQASTFGRIRSLDRLIVLDNRSYRKKGVIRVLNKFGKYWYIGLWVKKKMKFKIISRIILRTFISEPPTEDHVAMYIDSNPNNNYLSNLKWATKNISFQISHDKGRSKSPMKGKFGALHHASKKVVQMNMDGVKLQIFDSANTAAKAIKGSQGNIRQCVLMQRNHHKGYKWAYA